MSRDEITNIKLDYIKEHLEQLRLDSILLQKTVHSLKTDLEVHKTKTGIISTFISAITATLLFIAKGIFIK